MHHTLLDGGTRAAGVSLRSLDAVTVGDEVPELRRVVTREDVKTYADVGGDQNPLHQDDAFAHAAGFDGVIAHGMFTMGHLAACVTAWAGDPASVIALSAQFRAPAFLGDELIAGGSVRAVDVSARTATLDTWVRLERSGETLWPIKRGAATVRLD
jgi:acyl dehydratase